MTEGILPTFEGISPELVVGNAQATMLNISCISILVSAVFHVNREPMRNPNS